MVLDKPEKAAATLMQQLNAIRNAKAEKRRAASNRCVFCTLCVCFCGLWRGFQACMQLVEHRHRHVCSHEHRALEMYSWCPGGGVKGVCVCGGGGVSCHSDAAVEHPATQRQKTGARPATCVCLHLRCVGLLVFCMIYSLRVCAFVCVCVCVCGGGGSSSS